MAPIMQWKNPRATGRDPCASRSRSLVREPCTRSASRRELLLSRSAASQTKMFWSTLSISALCHKFNTRLRNVEGLTLGHASQETAPRTWLQLTPSGWCHRRSGNHLSQLSHASLLRSTSTVESQLLRQGHRALWSTTGLALKLQFLQLFRRHHWLRFCGPRMLHKSNLHRDSTNKRKN